MSDFEWKLAVGWRESSDDLSVKGREPAEKMAIAR